MINLKHFYHRKVNRLKYKCLTRRALRLEYPQLDLQQEGYTSQYGQDKYVLNEFFSKQGEGFFIDIGANDGVTFSNTYVMEQKGWKGIAIEPNPVAFEKLAKERHCHLENACIAFERGTSRFRKISGPSEMLSGIVDTYNEKHLQRIDRELKDRGGDFEDIEVPALTFSDLLDKYHVKQVDFLSIDIEGGELDVISNIDFNVIDVRVIAIENNYGDAMIPGILRSYGYEIKAIIGDEIYYRK